MKQLMELRTKRNTAVTAARAILDKASAEKRDLLPDETVSYDAAMADQLRIHDDIKRHERQLDVERELAATQFRDNDKSDKDSNKGDKENRTLGPRETVEYRSAFSSALRNGIRGISGDEQRALQAGSNVDGGYLVAPMQMVDMLLKAVDDEVYIRQRATKQRLTKALSLGVPSLDVDQDDATWTSELATGNEDTATKFGRREFTPNPLAKRIKISNKLIQVSTQSIEGIVLDRISYKFGITQEKAFMSGDGVSKPLGLFTASASGISTGRDVSSGNTTTAITLDGLINAKYSCKPQYMKVGEWLFHRDAIRNIAKLKDGDGQYMWQPTKTLADPDMLLGRPVTMSEYVPNTFTTGLYVGIFGDLSKYWIVDAMDMQVIVLKELYAETNQTGYIARLESDGAPALEEAFARVKLA